MAKHPMWGMKMFLAKRFKGKANITDHFIRRLYERFAHDEMLRIIVELNELFRYNMYRYVVDANSEHALVKVQNAIVAIKLPRNSHKLTLKTIY